MSRSFWFVFRPVYVLFSLYLMGDIFYRWDGLMYIGSFSDFLPSVALIAISWSAVAVVTALLLWITIRSLEWIFSKIGCRITLEHMMVFLGLMFVLPVMYLMNKTYDMKLFDDNFVKQILLSSNKIYFYGMLLTNLLLTWSLRKRVGKFLNIIQERITPLVWLFIIITVLSLPVVAYHTLQKDSDEKQLHGIANSEERNEKRPNIIYVMFDAMNAKDMSVYGYHRDTTPFIKKWAQQASVFKRAQAASNSTAPSTASIMTGKRVWTHKRYSKHGLEASKSSENLGLLMKNSGYYNMAFIASRRGSVKSIGVSDGFDVAPDASDFTFPVSLSGYIDRILRIFADRIPMHEWIIKEDFIFKVVISSLSSRISETTKAPEIAFNKFVSLLENGYVTEPYFAYIHVLPPHLPYLPPASYKGEFDT